MTYASSPILMLAATFLATCSDPPMSVAAEGETLATWKAQCLQDMAESVDHTLVSLTDTIPRDVVDEWKVTVDMSGDEPTVEFLPNDEISVRGGGGEYRFSCSEKTLELVQAYR